MVDLLSLDLLRRHVVRRTQELAFHGQVGGIEPGDAEVGNLDLSVQGDEDVCRLDVPMNHAAGVRVVEAFSDLREDVDRALDTEGLRAAASAA